LCLPPASLVSPPSLFSRSPLIILINTVLTLKCKFLVPSSARLPGGAFREPQRLGRRHRGLSGPGPSPTNNEKRHQKRSCFPTLPTLSFFLKLGFGCVFQPTLVQPRNLCFWFSVPWIRSHHTTPLFLGSVPRLGVPGPQPP